MSALTWTLDVSKSGQRDDRFAIIAKCPRSRLPGMADVVQSRLGREQRRHDDIGEPRDVVVEIMPAVGAANIEVRPGQRRGGTGFGSRRIVLAIEALDLRRVDLRD